MKKVMLLLTLLMSGFGFCATQITDLKVTPSSPFGKVIVEFNVEGDAVPHENLWCLLTCTEVNSGKAYSTTQVATVTDGRYCLEWNMAADGIRIDNKAVTFKVEYPTYLVIDLSGGTSATSYPVTALAAPPAGGWTDEYKTTKLVLRVIESGSYTMNGSYDVTISKPFYMGVFEVTQKQYQLVTGSNPSSYKGDARPVENVSWNTIRGNSDTYNWPSVTTVDSNSFMGKIRAKTGLTLDLPTEAQWEYACRAGTTSMYNNGGDTETDLALLGRYKGNQNDGRGGYSEHTKVGSYTPNAWGLYDMHGNVWEWCVDWSGSLSSSTDPKGVTSGTGRVIRGGGWGYNADGCTSSKRHSGNPSDSNGNGSFRLACPSGELNPFVATESDPLVMTSIPGYVRIANLKVTPISPFGKVIVEFNVEGDAVPSENPWWLTCTEVDSGKAYSTTQVATVTDGRHCLEWDMAADGIRLDNKAVTFKVEYQPTYLVIDLSGGTSATSYPVTALSAPPEGGWTNEYKTTKLVLRVIESGSYKMNGSYDVTISQPFYMGVFEVTQKQYQLVTGSNPASYKGDVRPVETVSWNMIRGSNNWPNDKTVNNTSFMGKLRAKTGLELDLPTEAQWEYACRAGTTSKYNNGGDAEADLKKLGRYSGNQNDGRGGYSDHTKVGSYTPNAWGLYDMHGNVWEWCLDWYGSKLSSGTDPKGATSGSDRVERGGSLYYNADYCTSSYRNRLDPSNANYYNGFRLACPAGL